MNGTSNGRHDGGTSRSLGYSPSRVTIESFELFFKFEIPVASVILIIKCLH